MVVGAAVVVVISVMSDTGTVVGGISVEENSTVPESSLLSR